MVKVHIELRVLHVSQFSILYYIYILIYDPLCIQMVFIMEMNYNDGFSCFLKVKPAKLHAIIVLVKLLLAYLYMFKGIFKHGI